MTFAPKTIKELASFWEDHGGRNLGIVGDTKHQQKGTSYHLGRSQLAVGAYSVRLKRDRRGKFPTEAASALDLGKLEKSIPKLRKFSNWLVEQAKDGKTPDIREIIWSPDGREVRRWDSSLGVVIVSLRRRKDKTIVIVNKGNGDATHFRHTHISFYRDSQANPKVAYFEPFFLKPQPDPEPVPDPEDDVDVGLDDEEDVDPPTPEAVFVKVQPSPASQSTLSGIAREFGTTVKKLLAFPENAEFRDDPGLVFAGQEVRVR
jgi:LysM repeat protein